MAIIDDTVSNSRQVYDYVKNNGVAKLLVDALMGVNPDEAVFRIARTFMTRHPTQNDVMVVHIDPKAEPDIGHVVKEFVRQGYTFVKEDKDRARIGCLDVKLYKVIAGNDYMGPSVIGLHEIRVTSKISYKITDAIGFVAEETFFTIFDNPSALYAMEKSLAEYRVLPEHIGLYTDRFAPTKIEEITRLFAEAVEYGLSDNRSAAASKAHKALVNLMPKTGVQE